MHAKIYSLQTVGLEAGIIDVEVDISKGLHSFSIVGLPDKAVEEAKDRINAAIKNSGFKPPSRGNKKVVVSLAPADVKKEGTSFDLAIALGCLKASGDIKFDPTKKAFLGELSLDGSLRAIRGVLILTKKARENGFTEIYVPQTNAQEAALLSRIKVYPVSSLKEITDHLSPPAGKDKENLKIGLLTALPKTEIKAIDQSPKVLLDFSDIKGQAGAKRGLEIAAAGGHNIAMSGPPGTGKTMLAKAFTSILPILSTEEIIEITGIHSVAGILRNGIVTNPPFRSPHHTASYVSLVGGGTWPKPGEITLAHRGVLFLDEFPEFEKRVIESLRQPLEDRVISISRSKGAAVFPAHFILVAAMNPCPCGHRFTPGKECVCSPSQVMRYERKLSGPIIDRIDLWLSVYNVKTSDLSKTDGGESSVTIKKRIERARVIQKDRFKNLLIKINSEMSSKDIEKLAILSDKVRQKLNQAADRLGFSARVYHRLIKLARTIADLSAREEIVEEDILEALQYRPKQEYS